MTSSKRAVKRATFKDEVRVVSVFVEYPVTGFPLSVMVRLAGVYLTIIDIAQQYSLHAANEEATITLQELDAAKSAVVDVMNSAVSGMGEHFIKFVDDFTMMPARETVAHHYPELVPTWTNRMAGDDVPLKTLDRKDEGPYA